MIKEKRVAIIIIVLLSLFIIIGTSYALWNLTLRQTETNIVTTDCFKVEFTDKNTITLADAYPLSDKDAVNLTPYEFAITNICSEHVRYEVNLEILNQTTLMNHSYIKAMYNEDTPKLLIEYESVAPTLSNATDSYNLEVGYLETNEKKSFKLRLYLDENTPLNEETMNKTLSSKVTVTTSYAKKTPGTLRTISSSDTTGMWEYKSNITKLVIQNKLNKINSVVKVSDESMTKDESIMSYVVQNEDGETYTAYLQGQDVIYLNSNSSCLFSGFSKLEMIEGIKYLDTSQATTMSYMFYDCINLTSLDLSSFDTSNVTNMYYMFSGCRKLTNLDLSRFDTSQVTIMSYMFYDCINLTSLDLSSFDTSNVTDMYYMFSGCKKITTLNLRKFDTSQVKDMGSMFYNCNSLTNLVLNSFDTSSVTRMSNMFGYCRSLISLDLSNFDTSNVTDMFQMFSFCNTLSTLDLRSFDTSNVTKISNMFYECKNLKSLDLGSFGNNKLTDISYMFYNCASLTTLDLGNFDTSNIVNMSHMFEKSGLVSLDLSSFDTRNVTNMSWMFYECSNLTNIDFGGFNTVNVTDMSAMFLRCEKLKTLDLSTFNTNNVTNMSFMLYECKSLKNITYGTNFIHKKEANITNMFKDCPANKPIHSSWNGVTF